MIKELISALSTKIVTLAKGSKNMTFIQYYNDPTQYEIDDVVKAKHIITITGANVPVNESGFNIIKSTGLYKTLKYPKFTTVYRILENGIQYSDDGSVYVESDVEE